MGNAWRMAFAILLFVGVYSLVWRYIARDTVTQHDAVTPETACTCAEIELRHDKLRARIYEHVKDFDARLKRIERQYMGQAH